MTEQSSPESAAAHAALRAPNPALMGQRTIVVDGLVFRDLDHDQVLAPFEDWRLPASVRVADLLARMTVEEKIGLLFHGTLPAEGSPLGSIGVGTHYNAAAVANLLGRGVNSMISRLDLPPRALAGQNNALQRLAADTRLGIPLTISTDPRHHVGAVFGAAVDGAGFSRFPSALGLGATADADLVRAFGDLVRREYRAVGFHVSLGPQADLATSPRWPRIDGTFGEDPSLVNALVGAYVEGIQGGRDGVGSDGVAAVVKHWVGYGASRDGFDGHNYYGRFSAFPGGSFAAHVDAFRDAFTFQVAGVMPTYNILDGLMLDGVEVEQVGAGYCERLLDGLLRKGLGYAGLVVSDWGITRNSSPSCETGVPPQSPDLIAMPWGVESLSMRERLVRGVSAGLDQFGGEDDPTELLAAVAAGEVSEARIDQSAGRVLMQKFQLGLFDQPFVDEAQAEALVGAADGVALGLRAQRQSVAVLKSDRPMDTSKPFLSGDDVVTVVCPEGQTPGVASAESLGQALADAGIVTTTDPGTATAAVVLVRAPHTVLHPTFFFGGRQHEGNLDYPDDHVSAQALRNLPPDVRVVVVAHLDRPAILTPFASAASALLCEFGISDAALVDVLAGHTSGDRARRGRLPFQISRSMDAALARPCDSPLGDPDPLYACGFGL